MGCCKKLPRTSLLSVLAYLQFISVTGDTSSYEQNAYVFTGQEHTLTLRFVSYAQHNKTEEETMPGEFLHHLNGDFVVTAPPNHGLMSVIEILHFGEKNDNCSNSIWFEDVMGPLQSKKICKEITAKGVISSNASSNASTDSGPIYYIDTKGKTRIHFDLKSQNLPYTVAKILFIPVVECPENRSTSTFGRCSSHNFSCVDQALFCELRLACSFEDELGLNDKLCPVESIIKNVLIYVFIFIGIIVISIMKLWCCYTCVMLLRSRL